MSKSRISFNVNAQFLGDSAYFMQVMVALAPASTTIMHGRELAREIQNQTGGKTVAIFRTDVDRDPDLMRMSPAAYVDMYVKNGNGYADLPGYILNEPSPSPGQGVTWKTIVKWLTEVGYRLADKKLPACIGNIGPGTFEKADVENGTFDPLLKMFHDTGKMHTFGIHEYAALLIPHGVGQWPREWLLEKDKVQIGNWPRNLPMSRTADGQLPNYWHLRRSDWLMIRCQEKGWSLPTVDMTEFGVDRLPDMTLGGQFNPYDAAQQKYGLVSPHWSYRGFSSLRNYYEAMFPQWGFDRAVFEQLKWADEIYPANYRAFHVFTWSQGTQDWDIQWGTNISRFKTLHTLLIDYANRTTTPPPPPPAPTPNPAPDDGRWEPYLITSKKGNANVRSYPTLDHIVNGSIPASGLEVLHIPYSELNAAERVLARPDTKYEWLVVKLPTGAIGWVRNDVVKDPFKLDPPTQPPLLVSQVYKDWLEVEKNTIKDSAFILSELEAFDVLIETLTEAVSGLRAWQREINSAAQARIKTIELILSDMEETP